jgi:hypothetical protein
MRHGRGDGDHGSPAHAPRIAMHQSLPATTAARRRGRSVGRGPVRHGLPGRRRHGRSSAASDTVARRPTERAPVRCWARAIVPSSRTPPCRRPAARVLLAPRGPPLSRSDRDRWSCLVACGVGWVPLRRLP